MIHARAKPERTRIRLFPQSPAAGAPKLETVRLFPRAGQIGPGPEDDRMYVADAPEKRPYGEGKRRFPPYAGPELPPVRPAPDGHLDHLRPEEPGFRQLHLYGCARMALDVWEGYLGRRIPWHFERDFERLEVLALSRWDNAHLGYGFLEAGTRRLPDGTLVDYALDFDIIAHEVGHAMMMSFAGSARAAMTDEYAAFHEASADWAALLASLHFERAVTDLLDVTKGDLDGFNSLTRFAELSANWQIRVANNTLTMWDFRAGWHDEHDLAQPLIAAFFDAFVQIYKTVLMRAVAIPPALAQLIELEEIDRSLRPSIAQGFARFYARRPEAFHAALIEAREVAATMLIGVWEYVDPTEFRFAHLPKLLRAIDRRDFGGALYPIVRGCLARRGIGFVPPGPRLAPPGATSHARSVRTAMPD